VRRGGDLGRCARGEEGDEGVRAGEEGCITGPEREASVTERMEQGVARVETSWGGSDDGGADGVGRRVGRRRGRRASRRG
jgi:hypothetical protein